MSDHTLEKTPASDPIATVESARPDTRLTIRSVAFGMFLAMIVAIWVPYCMYIMRGPRMTLSHMSVAALILFFIVIFFIQIPLQRWKPSWAFSKTELMVLFSMTLMASTIPGKAFVDYFLGLVSTPNYYVSPENRWQDVFFEILPGWLVAPPESARAFYEGRLGASDPWDGWITPLFWWMNMLAAMFLVTSCITVIFRRQWVEYERLSFPLVRIPMELIEKTGRGHGIPDFMKGRLFFMGFLVTFALLLWNCLSYFQWVPAIPIGTQYRSTIAVSQSIPPITVQFNIFAMCFAFFANLSVLFSIWFFYLIAILEIGLLNQVGISASGGAGGATWAVKSQHFGGFWVFVLWGFWVARHHLSDVIGKAFGRRPQVDDSDELFSYRTAILGLGGGLAYIGFWLNQTGMTLDVVAMFLTVTLLLYIGVARIVAETGMVFLDLPVNSNEFTVVAMGSSNLSSQNLTALGLGHAIAHNHRGMGLSSLIHSLKVADSVVRGKKGLFGVIALTMVITFIVTIGYAVYAGSTGTGAHNVAAMNVSGFYDQIVTWQSNATAMTNIEMYFLSIGGLITSGLLFMHYRFPWWPLHPIGYTVAYAEILVLEIASIFLVWLIKWLLLKIGGIELYRKTQPIVFGVLLGYAAGVAVSFAVDFVWFPNGAHGVHNW